jgi:hypothetical protein
MFVEELDVPVVDLPGDIFSYLMRRPALNHIQPRPSILRLSARRRTHKEVVLEFALEVVLLDMVG